MKFLVDGRPCESKHPALNAMEIKGLAGVPYSDNLYLVEEKPPERPLRDDESVMVDEKEFHSTPHARY